MKTKIKTQDMLTALETLGYVEVGGTPRTKQRKFKCKHVSGIFLFVGNDGTVRQGAAAETATSIGEGNKKIILRAARNKEHR